MTTAKYNQFVMETPMPWNRDDMAKRAARELRDG